MIKNQTLSIMYRMKIIKIKINLQSDFMYRFTNMLEKLLIFMIFLLTKVFKLINMYLYYKQS